MRISKKHRAKENDMTAQGKINASKVTAGDRIIIDLGMRVNEGDECGPSRTKTGEGVLVTRVLAKVKASVRRGYVIETGHGSFYAEPIQTMWLAPEDNAGIKRAYAEAVAEDARLDNEHADRILAHEDETTTRVKSEVITDAELEVAALRAEHPTATPERQDEIVARLANLGTVVYPEGTPEYEAYRKALRSALAEWVTEAVSPMAAVPAEPTVTREQALSAWGKCRAGHVPAGIPAAFRDGRYAEVKRMADAAR
jgi:hypothetical protein